MPQLAWRKGGEANWVLLFALPCLVLSLPVRKVLVILRDETLEGQRAWTFPKAYDLRIILFPMILSLCGLFFTCASLSVKFLKLSWDLSICGWLVAWPPWLLFRWLRDLVFVPDLWRTDSCCKLPTRAIAQWLLGKNLGLGPKQTRKLWLQSLNWGYPDR